MPNCGERKQMMPEDPKYTFRGSDKFDDEKEAHEYTCSELTEREKEIKKQLIETIQ